MINEDPLEYFEKREAEEREAASQADSDVARKIHLDLAEEYAAKVRYLKGTRTSGSQA